MPINKYLYVYSISTKILDVLAREIWPIFATGIRHLYFSNADHLNNLLRLISPTLVCDLNQLNDIYSGGVFPDLIADDGPNATAGQALSKWLPNSTKNGQPKRLCYDFYNKSEAKKCVNNFKEAFIRATTSATYNIAFSLHTSTPIIEQFELVNERTQEKLTLTKESEDLWFSRWVMKRCPIGEKAMIVQRKDENLDELNNVSFEFYFHSVDNCIGPLHPLTVEQSNEKMVYHCGSELI